MSLLRIIQDINQFLIRPNDTKLDIGFYQKTRIFLSAFLYKILVASVFIALLFIIDEYFYELDNSMSSKKLTFFNAFISMVIAAPLLEEFLFRFPLKYKRNYIFIGIEKVFRINLYPFWQKYFRIIFYLFAGGFGYLHLTNYIDLDIILILLSPLIIGTQIWGGLIYGYLRLKLGFLWSVFGHALNNFIVIILLLSGHNVTPIDIDNERMELKVTQLSFVDKTPIHNHYYYKTSTTANIDSIFVKNTDVQAVLNQIYGNDILRVKHNEIIHLTIRSKIKEGITREDLLIELKKEFDIVTILDNQVY